MRFIYKLQDYKNEVKYGFQRMFRGFDDTAYWSLYEYISDICIPVLDWMIEEGSGNPSEYTENEWNTKLLKMKEAFSIIRDDDSLDLFVNNRKQFDENTRKVKYGLKVFAENFRNLWD